MTPRLRLVAALDMCMRLLLALFAIAVMIMIVGSAKTGAADVSSNGAIQSSA